MTGAGLFPGDIAVVDRARTTVDGSIVLALLAGEFTVKRYRKKGARTGLQAENLAFENIEINEDLGFEVWGVREVDPHAVIVGGDRPRRLQQFLRLMRAHASAAAARAN